jgi:hypothetical protein
VRNAIENPVAAAPSQAPLAVSVVVPVRCAVRTPGTMAPTERPAAREGVAMRCTKGALPTSSGSALAPGAVGPQITRSFISASDTVAAPRPMSEPSPIAAFETGGPRMVITVNF